VIRAALVLVALLGGVASADTKVAAAPDPKPPPPDSIADEESAEANLESNAPREGVTLSLSLGGGLLLGGGNGVSRGPAFSIRLGHVATRHTVITFEASGTTAAHKRATQDAAVTDTNGSLYAGALRYASRSTWVRIAGGLAIFTGNVGSEAQFAKGGVGGLVGGGLDLIRWGQLVLGFEVFGNASVTGDGFRVNTGFCLGLTKY